MSLIFKQQSHTVDDPSYRLYKCVTLVPAFQQSQGFMMTSELFWKHFILHVREGYLKPQKWLAYACSNNSCSDGGDCHMISTASCSVWRNETWNREQKGAGERKGEHVKDKFKQSCMFLIVFLFSYWLNWDEQTGDVF